MTLEGTMQERAERLLGSPASLGALALAFDESTASSAEVLVEGASFYPPMLADIAAASSSVHINQFGFRPGIVGDVFAETLIAKAKEGVPVRLVVDRQGSDPEGGSKEFYDRLTAARDPGLRRARDDVRACPSALSARAGETGWNLRRARAHRPPQGRDRRRPDRLGRRRRDRGSLPGRPLPRPLRSRGGPGRLAAPARLPGELPLAAAARSTRRSSTRSSPHSTAARIRSRRVVLHNAPGRYRPITDAIAQLLDGAAETLDVVNPYVTDRGMIRRIERGRAARRPCSPLRSREREQLGVRRSAAVPPREAPGRRRAHPRLPDDAAREGVRPRRRGASSRERATSRPGASSASSRSTFSSSRASRPSSTSGSAPQPRRCPLRGVR